MIRIYSCSENVPVGYKIIERISDIKAYVSAFVDIENFDSTDLDIIRTIDNAEQYFSFFKTKFGTARLEDLSSGCQTALLINYFKKKNAKVAVSVIHCGGNALSVVYELVNNTNIVLIQRPMLLGSADTTHNIDYDNGEFTGEFFEYSMFLDEKAFEDKSSTSIKDERKKVKKSSQQIKRINAKVESMG